MTIQLERPAPEEIIEARALLDIVKAAPPRLKRRLRLESLSISGGCAISLPEVPVLALNRVVGLKRVEDLSRAQEWIMDRSNQWLLQLNERSTSDPDVSRWLEEKCFRKMQGATAKLVRGSEVSISPDRGIAIEHVTRADAQLFGRLVCEGFEFNSELAPIWSAAVDRDGWRCFIACIDGTPAATAMMFVHGEHAWLSTGSTLQQFRRRGAQGALIDARLADGRALGIKLFVADASAPMRGVTADYGSYNNLRRAAFHSLFDSCNYMAGP